jgi:hemerythrin
MILLLRNPIHVYETRKVKAMAYFQWKPEYSVKVAEIDRQHQKLVALINELYTAMESGKGKQAVSAAIVGLVNYTETHFAYEEKLLASHTYPALAAQKKEHEAFVAKVKDFKAKAESGNIGLTLQVGSFLKDWLTNHILKSDMAYSTHLNNKGVK